MVTLSAQYSKGKIKYLISLISLTLIQAQMQFIIWIAEMLLKPMTIPSGLRCLKIMQQVIIDSIFCVFSLTSQRYLGNLDSTPTIRGLHAERVYYNGNYPQGRVAGCLGKKKLGKEV